MTLGEKLQMLRKEQGLSQEALAAKVNVTRQTISKWELNQSTPDLALLAQLSDLFHVSTDCLIRNERTVPEELPAELLPGPPTVTLEEPLPEPPLLIPPL